MHGKDSPLVQQLFSISMMGEAEPTEPNLQSLPVDWRRTNLIKYLNEAAGALDTRYDKGFTTRRFHPYGTSCLQIFHLNHP